jgi:serine protease AprX
MGAAVTSGVAALVLDAHNRSGFHKQMAVTPNLVKAILEYSAIPIPGADALTQGTGEINADGATALADAIDTSARVGSWWLGHGVTPSSVIGGQNNAWARNIVWGDNVVEGELLLGGIR